MTDLKPEDLVKLREIAEKATPGTWTAREYEPSHSDGGSRWICADEANDGRGANLADDVEPEDAEFIAAFNPQVCLSLLADRARMEKALEEIRDMRISKHVDSVWSGVDRCRKIALRGLGASQ